jgi:hypothetical protein
MNNSHGIRFAYLLSVIGVGLAAITTVYDTTRSMFRPAAGPSGYQQFGNATIGNMTAPGNMNQGGMNPLGPINSLTLVAIVIAIVGLAWLGVILLKSKEEHN